ncbi:hypothetical protein D9757_002989 [Collybiopsis confluens]|uniref:Kinesin-like protein n=1 Tax=Collybiopsis confluens TaxID=2823264 RepID=A0A8H5HV69_9AGAR|nr:hypothetical protein D9757_005324 [Collybiopsis confluens]KAF5390179.1 hypothetical protein D9757_002989 [Collybiopsis confluens]
MSRLPVPRLRSNSPDRIHAPIPGPSIPSGSSLKRKAVPDDGEESNPLKKQQRLLQPSRIRTNLSQSTGTDSKALTKPRAPNLATTNRSTRGTSAPPPQTTARTVSKPPSATLRSTRPAPTLKNSAADVGANARLATQLDLERDAVLDLQQDKQALLSRLTASKELELKRRTELTIASEEMDNLRKRYSDQIAELEINLQKKERFLREAQEDLLSLRRDVERERETVISLKGKLQSQENAQIILTAENHSFQSQNTVLQTELAQQSRRIADLTLQHESDQCKVDEMTTEAMENELIRRKLHNMVQELKGNIRVFCRVRPVLSSDISASGSQLSEKAAPLRDEITADMAFPDCRDHKEITLASSSQSATGRERQENYSFVFDRVFEPHSTQAEVFEEISMLAQSCVDGYNVCIFAYGQTGSGKSFTMEGGSTDATQGMIPRAVAQVFRASEDLRSKGWEYKIEGQFLEIYNETVNDLLGKYDLDGKKHEIKHDPKTGSTRVTDITVLTLHSPTQVQALLSSAQSRRSVASTLMNERSSRSHSVFTLRITGSNPGSGENCEGSLNLVDLAGSERINVSLGNGLNDKDRVKETQNINRSLSALGDVISALGEKGDKHIPYRNSKLTYLLQNSLSGNSKTLMILNLSPLASHLNESLTSLRFATKVNNTTLGAARKQARSS